MKKDRSLSLSLVRYLLIMNLFPAISFTEKFIRNQPAHWVNWISIWFAGLFLIDFAVTYFLVRKRRKENTLYLAFGAYIGGTPWWVIWRLTHGLVIAERNYETVLMDGAAALKEFLSPETAREIEGLIQSHQYGRAARRIEGEFRRFTLEGKRTERLMTGIIPLIERASASGMSDDELEALFSQHGDDLHHIRDALGRRERHLKLLEEAGRLGCRVLIEPLLQRNDERSEQRARALMERIVALGEAAKALGVDDLVASQLRLGNLEAVEAFLQNERSRRERAEFFAALHARVDQLTSAVQDGLRRRIQALEKIEPGSRAYRMALYELEQALKDGKDD